MRKFLAAILGATVLSGCAAAKLPPKGLAQQLEQIPGVSSVELESSTPTNTGKTIWQSQVTLDAGLSPAQQGEVFAEFYRLVEASGEQASYKGGEFVLGAHRLVTVTETPYIVSEPGLLDLLAELPNHTVTITREPGISTTMPLATPADLFAQTTWLAGLDAPTGLSVSIGLASDAVQLGDPSYQRVSVALPLSATDRALLDELATVLADSAATGVRIAIPGVHPVQLDYVIAEPDPDLFARLVEIAAAEPRQMQVAVYHPGQSSPYETKIE